MTKENNPMKVSDIRKAVAFTTISNTTEITVKFGDKTLVLTGWSYEVEGDNDPYLLLTAEKEVT